MPACHSGLHSVKRKKNLLSAELTVMRKRIDKGQLGTTELAAAQSAEALVRKEVRSLHLADNYMRGRPYGRVEDVRNLGYPPDWDRIHHIVTQHGGSVVQMPPLNEWSMTN